MRRPAAMALLIILAACGGPAASSPPSLAPSVEVTPSASDTATELPAATPTASPAPTATPAPPTFQNVALATVRVNGLNVRTEPSSSAPRQTDVTGAQLSLDAGDHVMVLSGPVWGDDTWWFTAGLPQDSGLYAAPIPVGWIAGGTAAEPWIEEDNGYCPQATVATLSALPGVERVGCFGTAPLTFDARVATVPPDAGLGGACDVEDPYPRWLMCDHINYNWVNADGGPDWQFQLHFDPDLGITPSGLADVGTIGPAVRITGHFDDTASAGCVTASDPASLEAQSQRLTCATKFVVESLRYL